MLIFKKEKRVVELVKTHVQTTDASLKKARDVLEAYVAGDMASVADAAEKVHELESLADTIKRDIRDVLYDGAFLPDIRSDIYQLVASVDSVAGKAEDCTNFLVYQRPEIPEPFQPAFIEIFSISVACCNELTRAMKTFLKPKDKFEKLQQRTNRVGVLESEADGLEEQTMRAVFRTDLEYAQKLHLGQFLTLASSIADVAEKAAGQLMFTALKSRI